MFRGHGQPLHWSVVVVNSIIRIDLALYVF